MHVASVAVVAALFAVAAVSSVRGRPPDAGSRAPARVTLDVRTSGAARTFTAVCPVSIGRAGSSDLALDDAEVSRRHARLESRGGLAYLQDVGSSNGTFVNGRLLRGVVEIRPGDEIDVGTTRLVMRTIEEPWT